MLVIKSKIKKCFIEPPKTIFKSKPFHVYVCLDFCIPGLLPEKKNFKNFISFSMLIMFMFAEQISRPELYFFMKCRSVAFIRVPGPKTDGI